MATGCQWVGAFGVGFTLLIVGCSDGPMYPPFEGSSNGGDQGWDATAGGGRPVEPVFDIGSGGSAGAGNDCSSVFWDSRYRDGGPADAAHTDRSGNDGGGRDAGDSGNDAALEGGAVSNDGRPALHDDANAPGTPASCRLPLDRLNPGRLDFERVSITLSVDDSLQGFILRVASCSVDGGANGIAYDDPTSPTALVLCSSSCDWFLTHAARVTAHFSCREYYNPW
jgi:hypothetical protein